MDSKKTNNTNKSKNDRLSKAKQTFQQLKIRKATTNGLLTFRRKFKLSRNKRSRSKCCHHFRTLLSTWRHEDIESLHRHYELLSLHKALSNAADRAKPGANSVIFDLYELHQSGLFSDFQVFSSHLEQITETSGLLPPGHHRKLTRKSSSTEDDNSTQNSRNSVTGSSRQPIATSGKDVWVKKMSFPYMSEAAFKFVADLHKLMLSAAKNGDLRLKFTSSSTTNPHHDNNSSSDIYCHSFLLASRSTYFRKLLKCKWKRMNEDETSGKFLLLELDSNVFSSKYFRIVLNVMYTDQIDLSPLTSSHVTAPASSSSSAAASRDTSSSYLQDRVQDYIRLHQLASFIDFPLLVQGCEKALLELVTPVNFPLLLDWSSKPHGSIWLRRQLISYATEHFLQLSHTDAFTFLHQHDLEEIIQSDLVNSPELDIFQVVMRWGEEKILRRCDLQDMLRTPRSIFYRPSSSHRNVKSRNSILNTYMKRLKEYVEPLLVHIRFRHILPLNHQVVTTAVKRKIIHRPIYRHHPLDLLGSGGGNSSNETPEPICPFANMDVTYWLREFDDSPDFRPPRLYQAFLDEIKLVLSEESSTSSVNQQQQNTTTTTAINNKKTTTTSESDINTTTTTTIETSPLPTTAMTSSSSVMSSRSHRFSSLNVVSMATTRLKYVNHQFPVCSTQMTCKMLQRERLLRQRAWIRHILNLCYASNLSQSHCPCTTHPNQQVGGGGASGSQLWKESSQIQNKLCHLCRAETYLRLLVVREHGLHDALTDVVRRPHLYYDPDELYDAQQDNNNKTSAPLVATPPQPPSKPMMMTSVPTTTTSSTSCSVDSVVEKTAVVTSSQPGGALLLRHDDDDDVTVASRTSVPDVASSTTVGKTVVKTSEAPASGSLFHRSRASASIYARNLLHRGPKLRMVELLLSNGGDADDESVRTKSLPNFRTSVGGGKEPVEELETMPQLLLDGRLHHQQQPQDGGIEQQQQQENLILPDLYACNSLPRIATAVSTMKAHPVGVKGHRRSSDSVTTTTTGAGGL